MNGNVGAEKYVWATEVVNYSGRILDPNTILTCSQCGAALWRLNNDTIKLLGLTGHAISSIIPAAVTYSWATH